ILFRGTISRGVGNIDCCCPGFNGSTYDLAQISMVGTACVFCAKLDVVRERTRVGDSIDGHLENRLALLLKRPTITRVAELPVEVDIAGSDKGVDTCPCPTRKCVGGSLNVICR